ncbi:GntR family transcriptional regulator [Halobacillus sp. Marseille-P3879]|uniref:GntR family transcriptional regulator n=1 Tax=Halobacillus sp. Marseille-P3879 TaxID=2045014 RepID=UPI001F1925D9|nr:GntR family transcriptional regulator [Halobacillus sp. Marseille-P3879]
MADYKIENFDRTTLQFKVTTKLRELILKGEFKMGERLMQEEWAEKLGVSRMPVRDALRQLELEGLVRIEPRKGAIVTPISEEDIKEIYQLRALLEGEAIVKSLPYLEKHDLEKLDSLYNQMIELNADSKDVKEYLSLNAEFHKVLRSGCPWRRTQGFIDTLWKGIPSYTPSVLPNHLEEAHKEHRLMVEYAIARDADKLKEVTVNHILRTRDELIKMVTNNEEVNN